MKALINTLNKNQRVIFDQMNNTDRLQICLPTGVGKGYLMGVDVRNRFINGDNIIAIASHRLILNNQHMDDLIGRLSDMFKEVRFIFVGSSEYDHEKLIENPKYFRPLYESRLRSDEIILHSTNNEDLKEKVEGFRNEGKKVVIVSTYHSLDKLRNIDIDVLYADEAHTLASGESLTRFEHNFKSLSLDKAYFFTATPKDCLEEGLEDGGFLMDNKDVFGERVGMTMADAIKQGYITRPIIHTAMPRDWENEDMDNVQNKVKFILDTFEAHTKHIKESSSMPDLIEPKLLIKCESVDIMWEIYDVLLNSELEDVKLFAGASRKGVNGSASYELDGVSYPKEKHIELLKGLSDTEKSIIIHFDTLSEGVNVPGITGVMFLTDRPPSIIKLLQNIGRGTRILPIDRDRFRKGEINTDDYIGWVKPNSFVILPIYSLESETSQKRLSIIIKDIRSKSDISIHYVSIGNDEGKGRDDSLDSLVDNEFEDTKKKLVEIIDHNLEELYNEERNMSEAIRLNGLTKMELLREKFGKKL